MTISAARREELLEECFSRLANKLGYPRPAYLRHMGADRRWTFEREGGYFKTEAVCFLYRRRPRPRFMVDFLGSPLPADALAKRTSLEGVAIAQNLFDFQHSIGRCDPALILPSVIEVREREDISTIVARLEKEMKDVEIRLWPSLAQTWERATGSSPLGSFLP